MGSDESLPDSSRDETDPISLGYQLSTCRSAIDACFRAPPVPFTRVNFAELNAGVASECTGHRYRVAPRCVGKLPDQEPPTPADAVKVGLPTVAVVRVVAARRVALLTGLDASHELICQHDASSFAQGDS
jgi:hypothetical protein